MNHGGGIRAAAAATGIAPGQWLDLSTGINPSPYPLPAVPAAIWQRLPEANDGLEYAAEHYYGQAGFLAVPGSQWAIQHLPEIAPRGKIGVVTPTYSEYAHCWQKAGHEVAQIPFEQLEASLDGLHGLILANPNNPDGRLVEAQTLRHLAARLDRQNAWLLVDEAFIDSRPRRSLLNQALPANVMVLRSMGKFFGLAGIRLGFVFAGATLRNPLAQRLEPWAVSGVARWAGQQALTDQRWRQQTCRELPQRIERLSALLQQAGLIVTGRTDLFVYCRTPQAADIYRQLAQRGILVRLLTQPAALRFGLPPEQGWQRLQQTMNNISDSITLR